MEGTTNNTNSVGHSPGPWSARWVEHNARIGLGEWYFCDGGRMPIPLRRCSRSNRQAEANARLIAAAPDLLEACELIVGLANCDGHASERCMAYADAHGCAAVNALDHMINAAIAKAKGGAA